MNVFNPESMENCHPNEWLIVEIFDQSGNPNLACVDRRASRRNRRLKT